MRCKFSPAGDLFGAVHAGALASGKSAAELVAEQTPGGLNSQNIARLRSIGDSRADLFGEALPAALDDTLGALRRANATAPDGRPPK